MSFGESETDPLRGATRLIWLALRRGVAGLIASAALAGPDTPALNAEDEVRITAIRKRPKPKSPVG